MTIEIVRTYALSPERKAYLLHCAATGEQPRPAPGASSCMPIRMQRSESGLVVPSIGAPASAALVGASVAIGSAHHVTDPSRRRFLRGAASGTGALMLGAGASGCDPVTAAQLIYAGLQLAKALYDVLEEICPSLIVENPFDEAVENIGIAYGTTDRDQTEDALEQASFIEDNLGTFSVPPGGVELKLCGVAAKYADVFRFGSLLAASVTGKVLSEEFEVTDEGA